MSDGFLISITNQAPIVQEIRLFQGALPSGMIIESIDHLYDFQQLQQAATRNPFKGNALTTDANKEMLVEIVNHGHAQQILLNGRYEGADMTVDGQNSYIKIDCPANTSFYIRLHSIGIR